MRDIPFGLCQCGCGQPTTIPTSTNRKIGRFKGVPPSEQMALAHAAAS